MATTDLPEDPFKYANERIRDAAKWLIAASAAVGAILVAGSQLSSIGRLQAGPRLWLAIAGAVLALWGVVAAIWTAVRLMLPVEVTLQDVQARWERWQDDARGFRAWRQRTQMPDVAFFKRNRIFLGGVDEPRILSDNYEDAAMALKAARDVAGAAPQGRRRRRRAPADADLTELEARQSRAEANLRIATQYARHHWLAGQFRRMLPRLLLYAAMTAVGIGLFAWAANPSIATVRLQGATLNGAVLRDADLSGVDLTGADLSNADLTGASLSGAIVNGVRWSNTTCPDGTNSDEVGQTCRGHLG